MRSAKAAVLYFDVLSFFQQLVYEMFNTLFFKCSHMDMTIRKSRIYHQRLNGY